MKKNVFVCSLVLCSVLCGFIIQNNNIEISENVYLKENIEALSQAGDGLPMNSPATCYSESKVSTGYTYIQCGDCKKVYDEKGKGSTGNCYTINE